MRLEPHSTLLACKLGAALLHPHCTFFFSPWLSHRLCSEIKSIRNRGLELLQSEVENITGKADKFDEMIVEDEVTDHLIPQKKLLDWLSTVNDLMENCQSSVTVLNDILSYDKIQEGVFQLEVGPGNIWELVRKAIGEFQVHAKERKVTLTLGGQPSQEETEEDLERGAAHREGFSGHCVMGDDVRLTQVIRNLVSNALKFTPAHQSVEVNVSCNPNGLSMPQAGCEPVFGAISSEKTSWSSSRRSSKNDEDDNLAPRRAGSVSIAVVDKGVGMDEYSLSVVFGEGVQVDANKLQHGGGSGLGLFIARNIVHQHGGNIWAQSDGSGLGSTFTVELPLYDKPLEDESPNDEPLRQITSQAQGHPKSSQKADHSNALIVVKPLHRRILVVEDVLSNSKMLVRILERAGNSCITAMNGQEAIDAVADDMAHSLQDQDHQALDTILMDYEMRKLFHL